MSTEQTGECGWELLGLLPAPARSEDEKRGKEASDYCVVLNT